MSLLTKEERRKAVLEADEPPWDQLRRSFERPISKTFDGNHCNDFHYVKAFKQAARDRKRKG